MHIPLALFALLTIILVVERIRTARAHQAIREALNLSASTGDAFFRALVLHLSRAFKAEHVAIAELSQSGARLRTIAAAVNGQIDETSECDVAQTPHERAIASSPYVVTDNRQSIFPADDVARTLGLRSYVGVALLGSNGVVLGVMTFGSRERLRKGGRFNEAVVDVLALRASAEMERRRSERALQDSEAKTRAILRAVPDLMFVQDRDGRYIDYYAAASGDLYVQPSQFIGKRHDEVLPPQMVTAIDAGFRRVADSGESATVEYQLSMPDVRYYEARLVQLPPDRVLSVVRELTEKKRAEKALEESRYFVHRLAETLPNVVFLFDLKERRNVYVNERSEAIIGYTAAEVIEMGDQFLPRTMHPDDVRGLSRLNDVYAQAKDGEIIEQLFRFRHKNGDWRWISRCVTVFARDTEGQPTQVIGSATDVTALKTAEEELRSLSARLLDAQDEERRRIARELHDGVAQCLFGISAFLATLRQSGELSAETAEALAEVAWHCDEGLKQVRGLSYILHPPMFDEVGLVPALKWFASGLERRSDIRITVEAEDTMQRLPLTVERDLFRIVQEALINVIRHSGSSKAVVRLSRGIDQAEVQIQDFGRGMPVTAGSSVVGQVPAGVGILGMRERLHHVNGRLKIESGSHGTSLTAIVPLAFERVTGFATDTP